jgi:hypothetical protein
LQEKLVPRDFHPGKNSKWATKEIYELISLSDRNKNKKDESFARFNLHNNEVSHHLKFDVRHPVSTFLWFDEQFPEFNNNIHKNLIGIDRRNYVNSTSNDSNVIKGWDLNATRNRIGLCERKNSTSICKESEIRVMNNRLHSSSSKGWGSNSMLSRSKNSGWGINASNKSWANPAPIQRSYRSWGNINSGNSNSIAVKGWDKSQYISDGNMKVNEVPWAAVLPCDASINDSTSNVIEVQAEPTIGNSTLNVSEVQPDATIEDSTSNVTQVQPDVTIEDSTSNVTQVQPDATIEDSTLNIIQLQPDATIEDSTLNVTQVQPDATIEDSTLNVIQVQPDATIE